MNQELQQQETPSGFNLYAFMRRLFFVGVIVVSIIVIFYLLYQNGKSIYDNGI